MSRMDELLDRAVAGGLTQEEARELREMMRKERSLSDLDQRVKMLIAFGVGAAAGYALPRLLELENAEAPVLNVEPETPETQAVQPARRARPRR